VQHTVALEERGHSFLARLSNIALLRCLLKRFLERHTDIVVHILPLYFIVGFRSCLFVLLILSF
jgi:hypothetical protein